MSNRDPAVEAASTLMLGFADRTGLTSEAPRHRYLWTDAFAVCNFLGLARATGEQRFTALALRLVNQVHEVLGRHRPEGPGQGWLSGLGDAEGAAHPTLGGLRIGKKLPERRPDEPFDPQLEWDRDGQYFHYLTKWMHALDQTARATGEARFNLWARELADVACRAFAGAGDRMVWKMSIDLSRPLVPSMGQHDPLDGLVTARELEATEAAMGGDHVGPSMAKPAARFAAILADQELETADPLGLGGLLMDADRADQLLARGSFPNGSVLRDRLLASALAGLPHYLGGGDLQEPASRRLAFRELGLVIGLTALGSIRQRGGRGSSRGAAIVAALEPYESLVESIRSFWLDARNRDSAVWSEHRDINDVMLATSLAPAGMLVIQDRPRRV